VPSGSCLFWCTVDLYVACWGHEPTRARAGGGADDDVGVALHLNTVELAVDAMVQYSTEPGLVDSAMDALVALTVRSHGASFVRLSIRWFC